jgi:hypothetical protein
MECRVDAENTGGHNRSLRLAAWVRMSYEVTWDGIGVMRQGRTVRTDGFDGWMTYTAWEMNLAG